MSTPTTKITKTGDRNEDLITGEPGSHPVSTGVGAAGAGTIGVAVGSVVGGPVGGLIGAAVGAIVGGLSGSAVGEAVDPTTDTGFTKEGTVVNAGDEQVVGTEPLVTSFDAAEESGEVIDSTAADEDIAARAWLIYEAEGRPDGRSEEHWLRAERELKR